MVDLLQQTPETGVEPKTAPKRFKPASEAITSEAITSEAATILPRSIAPRRPQPTQLSINQVALQFPHSLHPSFHAAIGCSNAPVVAPAIRSAMQRLVDRITHLQAGGWVVSAPQSPQALLPRVLKETKAVLTALHLSHLRQPSPSNSPNSPSPSRSTSGSIAMPPFNRIVCPDGPGHLWLKTLAPWLVWSTIRSSHEVMHLLEGQIARVSQPDRSWQTGILRLVPFLSLRPIPDRTAIDACTDIYTVDLAPKPVPCSVLPLDAQVYFDSAICQQPVPIAALLKIVQGQIQQTTPSIGPFLQGMSAQVWMPQQSWAASTIQLHYRLEFAPLPQRTAPAPLMPLVKFADPTWLKQYAAAIQDQQLTRVSAQIAKQVLVNNRLPSPSAIVVDACALSDHLQNGLAIVSRSFTPQELELRELIVRLRWCLIHSTYEGMQLFRGILVTLVSSSPTPLSESSDSPQTGILRFAVYLHLRSPQQTWKLDLMSGRLSDLHPSESADRTSAHTHAVRLPPTAIVQSHHCAWCQPSRSVQQLQAMLWQQIHTHTPELSLLLQSTPIGLYRQSSTGQTASHPQSQPVWQPSTMQLKGQFEWRRKEEGRGQKAEGRGQKAEGRRQRAEGRRMSG